MIEGRGELRASAEHDGAARLVLRARGGPYTLPRRLPVLAGLGREHEQNAQTGEVRKLLKREITKDMWLAWHRVSNPAAEFYAVFVARCYNSRYNTGCNSGEAVTPSSQKRWTK